MALGLIFWVSCVSILIDSNVGSPTIKGYGYRYGYLHPYKTDSRNLVDDGDDDVLTSDQNNQQAENNQPAGFAYKRYNKRSAKQQQNLAYNQQYLPNTPSNAERFAKQQDLVSTQQNLPNAQSAPKMEGLVKGESRQWGLVNLNEPLLFPLRSGSEVANPVKPNLAAVKPHSTSFNVYASTMPLSTSTGETTHTSQTAYYEPASSSTFQAVAPPSYESWQPEPLGNGNGVADSGFDYPGQDFSTGDGADHSRNKPNLVFEEVFLYPSENSEPPQSSGPVTNAVEGYSRANYMSRGSATGHTSTPVKLSFPNNVQAKPFYQSWRGVPSSSKFFGGRKRNFNPMFRRPQNAVFSTPWAKIPSRVKVYQSVMAPSRGYQPILHHPHPLRYTVRSRSSYQRGRYIQSKTRYTPEYPPNGLKSVRGPAQN